MKHDSSKLYKIAVSYLTHTPKDLDEIQDLFEKLGYHKSYTELVESTTYIGTFHPYKPHFTSTSWCKLENHTLITEQQLKDMVVLERNDVNDATHCFKFCADDKYLKVGSVWYYYSDNEWVQYREASVVWFDTELVAIKQTKHKEEDMQNKEDGLISGADALRALADGKELDIFEEDVWEALPRHVSWRKILGENFKLRIKPHTILLNGIEIPAPFTPKVGDKAYFLSTNNVCGYTCIDNLQDDVFFNFLFQFGAWRTEAEIKQVVEALRSVFKPV